MANLILHINSATDLCSIALSDGPKLIEELIAPEVKKHSESLGPMIQSLLRRHHLTVKNLKALAIVSGPGSYTGLRVGISMAKGMFFDDPRPVFGVPLHEMLLYDSNITPCKSYQVVLHKRRDTYLVYHYDSTYHLKEEAYMDLEALLRLKNSCMIGIEPIDGLSIRCVAPTASLLIKPALRRQKEKNSIQASRLLPIYFDAAYITKRKKELL